MVAGKWHIIVTWFLIGLLLISAAQELITGEDVIGAVIASLLIFVALPIVDWLMGVVFARLLGVSGPAPGETEPATAAADQTEDSTDDGEQPLSEHAIAMRLQYRDVLVRNFRIVLGVLGVLVLAGLWDIDIRDFAASGVGETVAAALVDIVITLILASAVWGIVKTAIQQAAASDEADHEAHEAGDMGGKGGARLQTLVPLFGRFLLVTITVIVTLIILSELSVDIGPLIAGAGVVGLAVGFGAQTLVKDILSGVFFLIDDAFRVGEYVVIGEVRGMVEHISIRSLRLRHHRGPVHTIPFGEIRHLTNYSRDWAIMKLEMRLPFDTDLEKVRKLVKKVGQEMMDDPVHGPNFLQPVKSQGVNRMDDSAFIVRVKFMAKPGEQFTLRREVFRRIQESFAENGIQFAPRRVIVDTLAALSGAAAALAAEADEDHAKVTNPVGDGAGDHADEHAGGGDDGDNPARGNDPKTEIGADIGQGRRRLADVGGGDHSGAETGRDHHPIGAGRRAGGRVSHSSPPQALSGTIPASCWRLRTTPTRVSMPSKKNVLSKAGRGGVRSNQSMVRGMRFGSPNSGMTWNMRPTKGIMAMSPREKTEPASHGPSARSCSISCRVRIAFL